MFHLLLFLSACLRCIAATRIEVGFREETTVDSPDAVAIAKDQLTRSCLVIKAAAVDTYHGRNAETDKKLAASVIAKKLAVIDRMETRYGKPSTLRKLRTFRSPKYRVLKLRRATLKKRLSKLGLDWDKALKECEAQTNKKFTDAYVRLNEEFSVCDGGPQNCSVKKGEYCPEGYTAQYKKGYNMMRAAQAMGPAYAAASAGSIIAGGALGALFLTSATVSLPAAIASGVGAQAILPTDLAVAMGIAGYIGTEKAQCKCFPEPCQFDRAAERCFVANTGYNGSVSKSSNPLAWLPFPGTRCTRVPRTQTCKLEPCSVSDFASDVLRGYKGAIGYDEKGVLKNCLSVDGNPGTALSLATTLPNGHVNSAKTRVELLTRLIAGIGVQLRDKLFPSYAAERHYIRGGASSLQTDPCDDI
eukprot:TRINITY_DN30302_c0_g1_i1.p1 TRINITY_DN30302_c0_g1~~TRINITY_DN30302_c0_g1_i1.p1  ORF type:complete len:416 (-),score=32.30 TRINITY_DN30302_c0_g1_i1:47-1294(-)